MKAIHVTAYGIQLRPALARMRFYEQENISLASALYRGRSKEHES
jgi:hypothetical protein